MKEMPDHYSLIHDKDDHFMVHDARDGKAFPIAKKHIHPAHQIKIMKLKKFSEGGESEGDDSGSAFDRMGDKKSGEMDTVLSSLGLDSGSIAATEAQNQAQREKQMASDQAVFGSGAPEAQAPPPMAEAVDQATAPTPQGPAPASVPQAPLNGVPPVPQGAPTLDTLKQAQGMQESGLRQQAQGQMEQNKQLAQAQAQHQALQAVHQQMYEANVQKYQTQYDQIYNDVVNKKINPDQYWDNHSRVGAALAVIVSGIGAGLQHSTQNLAMNVIQDGINKSIESQKDDLMKKEKLLGMNLNMQEHLMHFENQRRLEASAALQGKLTQIALETGNPMIQGLTQQRIGALRSADAPRMMEAAQYDARTQMLKQYGGPSSDQNSGQPVNLQRLNVLKMTGMIPKEDEGAITKEANELAEARALRKEFEESFHDLNQKALAGNLTPGQRDAATWILAGKLQHASAGRFNLEDAKKQMDAMLPQGGDLSSTRDIRLKRSEGLFDTLEAGTQTLQRYGLVNPIKHASPLEGKTAVNDKGERLIMKNGKWVPHG